MRKFNVCYTATGHIQVYYEVEAKTAKEAREIADSMLDHENLNIRDFDTDFSDWDISEIDEDEEK